MEPNLVQIFGSYMSWKLNENTWIINFMNGSQNMYLLEGAEKALLIDTGWGAGNLRALVEKLTTKPVIVTNNKRAPARGAHGGVEPSCRDVERDTCEGRYPNERLMRNASKLARVRLQASATVAEARHLHHTKKAPLLRCLCGGDDGS